MSSCACGEQESAAVLSDIETARSRREEGSGRRQQVRSHVPLGWNDEDVFPSVRLQSWRAAAGSTCRLLGERWRCNWFRCHCCRHQHQLRFLPLKSDKVKSSDVRTCAAICYCPQFFRVLVWVSERVEWARSISCQSPPKPYSSFIRF